jgi:hypothetical protein
MNYKKRHASSISTIRGSVKKWKTSRPREVFHFLKVCCIFNGSC